VHPSKEFKEAIHFSLRVIVRGSYQLPVIFLAFMSSYGLLEDADGPIFLKDRIWISALSPCLDRQYLLVHTCIWWQIDRLPTTEVTPYSAIVEAQPAVGVLVNKPITVCCVLLTCQQLQETAPFLCAFTDLRNCSIAIGRFDPRRQNARRFVAEYRVKTASLGDASLPWQAEGGRKISALNAIFYKTTVRNPDLKFAAL
jgi:hypothetical protein